MNTTVRAAAPKFDRRVLTLISMGFSSGLPLALSGASLQAWLTVSGTDLSSIGLLSLAGAPYSCKFLWAPFLDRYAPPFADARRSWLIMTQIVLAALLLTLALTGVRSPWLVGILAFSIAGCSATQDVAFDAYRTELLPAAQRGLGAASAVLGYRLAMLTSGGLALVMADRWVGWQATYASMAGLMMVLAIATAFSPPLPQRPPATESVWMAVKASWRDFFDRRNAMGLLALIVLYKLGDAFAGSLSTAFLIRGVGFSVTEVGAVNKLLGLVTTIVGAFAGGALLIRLGLFRALLLFGLLQAVSNLAFWYLSISPKNLWALCGAITVENLAGGMGTAAFVALLSSLCTARFSATQYALLSALSAFGRVYLTAPAGIVVASIGWPNFFLGSTALALPSLVLLLFLKRAVDSVDR
ncbi:MAG: AmpG family muropeptide MFS transporter [Burkholderiaceae bacterium]|jgi:PAT family beta-lactamase induction signal transducer AmpG